ncbi:hypothetical protein [Pelagibacterium mangrovi]|uniref:hypothetical protein n=1 Tax=Pelagibacterium mangrovi TaxID=3119828 RepID=UPI002FC7F52D
MRDEITTGEAAPKIIAPREARAMELRAALVQFIDACADAPGPNGGLRHISVFAKCTFSKLELRRALNRFCDASGVARL